MLERIDVKRPRTLDRVLKSEHSHDADLQVDYFVITLVWRDESISSSSLFLSPLRLFSFAETQRK
jgi:hypothetical protein